MAELSSLDLLLAAAAVGVAVWTDVIGSPDDRVNMFQHKYARHATRWMLFLSATILLLVFGAFGAGLFAGVSSGTLGVGGTALFLVILSIALAGIPTIVRIYVDIVEQVNKFEGREELIAGIAVTVLICGTVLVLVTFVT